MASRDELLIIRAARAGQAAAQLTLGKRYLFGGAGLPKSLPTALYWLDRAAHQDEEDAWLLIGSHVPFETAQQAPQPSRLCVWYERAYDAGVAQAGLVLAKLVLAQVNGAVSESMRDKALRALQAAAQAGIAEAQWLLAQHARQAAPATPSPAKQQAAVDCGAASRMDNGIMLEWAIRAAQSGVPEARHALADHAWATGDYREFVRWALPLARELEARWAICSSTGAGQPLVRQDLSLLSRCADAMFLNGDLDAVEAVRFWECAARAGDRNAQFSLGLWFARMDANGRRVPRIPGTANYKKSIRWLSLAAEQGVADAWYALSRIYLKPECSQRNLTDAQRYLERAAEAGHAPAQLELGITAWRTRRDQASKDLRAVYWLQKASAQGGQGGAGARALLEKIASRATPARWAQDALRRLTREAASMYPLLAARIELAALFGLSRSEALLLDPKAADCGHCLLIDIRARHRHSKRRLILLQTGEERQALDRIVRLFEYVDCGPEGPEGNYRQRLYRLRTMFPD